MGWYSYYTVTITLRPHYSYDIQSLGRQLHCTETINSIEGSNGRQLQIRRAFKYGSREELINLGFFIRRVIGDTNIQKLEGSMMTDGESDDQNDLISIKKDDYNLDWNFDEDLSVPDDHGKRLEWEPTIRYLHHSLVYGPIERDESNPEPNDRNVEYTECEPTQEFTPLRKKTRKHKPTPGITFESDSEPEATIKRTRQQVRSLAVGPTQAIRVNTNNKKRNKCTINPNKAPIYTLLITGIVLELIAIYMIWNQ